MAIVLILLLLWHISRIDSFVLTAIGVHVVNMTAPQVYRPAAVIWFAGADIVGMFVSRVVLTIIFFAVVTPVGIWRRTIGADSLRLKAFKAGRESVMDERNHTFTGRDLERPY
jgi:hypothetical protein